MTHGGKSAAELRAELGHPVIDNDGHILEIGPSVVECVREVGGADIAERYLKLVTPTRDNWAGRGPSKSLEERIDGFVGQTSWWSQTANTYDRATSMLPGLFAERLGELGIDFAVLYATEGLFANRIEDDDELRIAACRAINLYQMDLFKGVESQLTPVAVIPAFTPQEALDEIDYAVTTLGYKTILLPSGVRRGIPKYEREAPDVAHLLRRVDFYGIDSVYDYDPVWQKCVDLGVPVTFHGQTVGTWAGPVSVTNNTFNRLGTIGNTYPALVLAFLLGGVTSRFPTLKFMFQEGGAGWISTLFTQLCGVWEKRSAPNVYQLDPARLDLDRLVDYVKEYGNANNRRHIDAVRDLGRGLVAPANPDDFANIGASTGEELRDVFVEHFYAGCEADDLTNVHAYSNLPFGAVLRTTFGSDIGHWDVFDANDVLPEAFELIDDGLLDAEQLRSFLFGNAYELFTSMNPDFFVGTQLEDVTAPA